MFGLSNRRPRASEYDEDFFKESRMSFGDHLEELRTRMWLAIKGFGLCLIIGFVLDGIGSALDLPWLGIGRPMYDVITAPVEEKLTEFYHAKNESIRKRAAENKEEKLSQTIDMRYKIPVAPLMETFEGLKLKNPEQTHIDVVMPTSAVDVKVATGEGEFLAGQRVLKGMGVMEPFWVYMKISLLCGVVIGCPWIFWQMWAFIGAGLYPHEKKLVHVYLPFSIMLFLAGVLICQFIVLPRAVEAMLTFYSWLDIDPDLRLSEWLSFALVMPLVFGISFQTPIVMLFLNRIGIFGWQDYLSKWRYALFILTVLSAVLSPTTDLISLLWLLVPTFGLYMLGIAICYTLPPPSGLFGGGDDEAEVGV
jgi:sec-independent protein translocase protein TatC